MNSALSPIVLSGQDRRVEFFGFVLTETCDNTFETGGSNGTRTRGLLRDRQAF